MTAACAKFHQAVKAISERCSEGFLAASSRKGPSAMKTLKKHRVGFIVHFQKPLRVPKIGIGRIEQGEEQES